VIRTLTHSDLDAIHLAFVDSFSDYVIKLSPTREQLLEMFTRRGWVPELSVAAMDDGRIVGFTINGVDGDRGYDSGTGVVLSHRRRGLSRALMDRSCELLREAGCKEYVLEVLEANEKAAQLYRDCGFRETRRLQCWTFDPRNSGDVHDPLTSAAAIEPQWWTSEPSWQNSSHSIARARDPHVILGTGDGYVVVFPSNGDVPQLAVRPEARRNGLGRRLLISAAALAGKPLRLINVDDNDRGTAAFLESVGAQRTVRQIEMKKLL
jgi:ribosomal protein S18 acetylase RimI-like enzyme